MNTAVNVTPQGGSTAWHAMGADEVLRRLDSNAQSGLEAAEIPRRLEQYGRNKLPEGRKQGPFMRFLMQLNNILVYVLLAAGFVKLMVGLWLDAAIILGVVLLNALLGFIQEGRAEKAGDRNYKRPFPHATGSAPSALARLGTLAQAGQAAGAAGDAMSAEGGRSCAGPQCGLAGGSPQERWGKTSVSGQAWGASSQSGRYSSLTCRRIIGHLLQPGHYF